MILKTLLALSALFNISAVNALTVYGLGGASLQSVSTSAPASASGSATSGLSAAPAGYTPPAFKTVVLNPPPVPSPLPPMQFSVQLESSATDVSGLSIPQSGAFFGFSIEMSIINQVSEYLVVLSCTLSRF